MGFIAVKMDKMKNIQTFMLNNILYYHFPQKKLAEKSYSTAMPIKTNHSHVSCMALIHRQEAEPAKYLKLNVLITFSASSFGKMVI